MAPGTNCVHSIITRKAALPRNLNRAMAYPPSRANRVVSTRVSTAMMTEFLKKTANPAPFQTVAKCSRVAGHGNSAVDPVFRKAKSSIQ